MNNNNPDLTYLILAPFMLAYLVVLLWTLITAYRTMARLRTSPQSWDSFVLTGIDAQGVIFKYWRTVIHSMQRPFIAVVALRAVVLCLIGADYWQRNFGVVQAQTPTFYDVLLVTVVMFALGLIQLPFVTACGILGCLSENKLPGKVIRGITLWLLIALIMGILIWFTTAVYSTRTYHLYELGVSDLFFTEQHRQTMNVLVWSGASFLDSGVFSNLILTSSLIYSHRSNFIVVAIVATGCALLTWTMLRLCVWLAVRQGMLSQRESAKA